MMTSIINYPMHRGELGIFWLGQNSFILKTSQGTLIAIDPYFSRTPTLQYVHDQPPIRPEDLRVDYIFCTHDHWDHTDPITLPLVAYHSPTTQILGPPESCQHCIELGINPDQVQSLTANHPYSFHDFHVSAYYSIPPTPSITTHYGYLFDFEFVTVYNMGDSNPAVVKNPMSVLYAILPHTPKIAMFPIIGDFPSRKPEDAYRCAQILGSNIVIPCHYDCFRDRTIDPQKFVNLFTKTEGTEIRPHVIEYQGVYRYTSRSS